ncbi:hypothetical protein CTAYLR_007972 [Chrysophaeum taylorii]|uniref:Zn(2)-C6 fungal-type domain-containing protein n=1 Tax=Chrysophaeum taylorii TaxID=2483200 RepID=A0AAD7UAI7_9STRA|nr:hypothetical protein CTAYLR_007972 [Chrysophaeum taylorii]
MLGSVDVCADGATCLPCRMSKVRCDRRFPCGRCRRRRTECVAQIKERRRQCRMRRQLQKIQEPPQFDWRVPFYVGEPPGTLVPDLPHQGQVVMQAASMDQSVRASQSSARSFGPLDSFIQSPPPYPQIVSPPLPPDGEQEFVSKYGTKWHRIVGKMITHKDPRVRANSRKHLAKILELDVDSDATLENQTSIVDSAVQTLADLYKIRVNAPARKRARRTCEPSQQRASMTPEYTAMRDDYNIKAASRTFNNIAIPLADQKVSVSF